MSYERREKISGEKKNRIYSFSHVRSNNLACPGTQHEARKNFVEDDDINHISYN